MEDIVRWGAPLLTTIAALMTASNLGSRITGWGFGVFLAGSILWTALGAMTGQPNLVWQNVILSLLNLFGMWRWLGRQAQIEEGGEKAHARSEQAASETLFPVSLLTNASVIGSNGKTLGVCVDAMAGCASGRVAYVVASEGGIAGVGERLHRLDWQDIRAIDDKLLVKSSTLEGFTVIERGKWPGR